MPWYWRKGFSLGPLRYSFSRRGLGWSTGFGLFRYGVSPSGQSYVSFRIPGTGLYFRKNIKGQAGRRPPDGIAEDRREESTQLPIPAAEITNSSLSDNQKIVRDLTDSHRSVDENL